MKEILQKNYIDKGILAISIKEYCRMKGYTTPTYYKLRAMGKTPEESRYSGTNLVRITIEAIDRHESAEPLALEVDEQKARLRQRSVGALAAMRADAG